MYNIDWSDDVATENVKEQFATLRSVFKDCLITLLRVSIWDFWQGFSRSIFWNPIKSFFIYNAAENIKTDMVI